MRLRAALAFSFVGLSIGAAAVCGMLARREFERTVPGEMGVAKGVRVRGEVVPEGTDAAAFIGAKATQMLETPISIRYQGEEILKATPGELVARVDTEWAVHQVSRIGRRGDLYDRYQESKLAAGGGFDVELPVSLGADELGRRLTDLKDDLDERPESAKRHIGGGAIGAIKFASEKIDPEKDGSYLDAFDAAEQVVTAMREGRTTIDLVPYAWVPKATRQTVEAAQVGTVVSSFETRFGGPPGRDQNIYRAASLIDGTVLLPHDELSFNAIVGARSLDNGFAMAPEIYKGEIRDGVGGGACQVASTLHAAAFFGGLEVKERAHHSRASAYIKPGLDATVSYPVLDLKLENPFDFPVVVHATAEKGILRFELLGKEKPMSVELRTETSGIYKYNRKIEKALLPEGEYRVKQAGRNGMSIKKTKTIHPVGGVERVEETTDIYPAIQEVIAVGPNFDATTLPPLPDADGAKPNG